MHKIGILLLRSNKLWQNRKGHTLNNLADIKKFEVIPWNSSNNVGSEKSTEHRERNEKYAGHTDKVSGLNELKNLATREKLEVWGINSTLGNYQMAVHWKNIYKSYHENIMFFREKIINCFLKIIIIMIFFLPIFRLVKKS